MTDREKVIRLIEEEISVCESVNQCYRTIDLPALRDILALLKEQEAVNPHNTYSTTPSGKIIPHIFCGKCNKEIYAIYAFCPFCGQAVKWDA